MLPVTSIRTTHGTGNGPYYLDSIGFRQRKPFNLLLELDRREGSTTGIEPWRSSGTIATWAYDIALNGDRRTDNRAYSRFVGKLHGDRSDLGVTLGEHSAARQAMTNRFRQLVNLTDALKRRDFRRAFSTLKVDSPPGKPFRPHREFAANYLEWSWGWRPMFEDIYASLEVLTSPIFDRYIRAASIQETYTTTLLDRNYDGPGYGCRLVQRHHEVQSVQYKSSTGAQIKIENPNVVLANRLGLINPAKIFWAVQPFSFVVDKYVNVGQMIGSLTDLYGFTLSQAWNAQTVATMHSGYMVTQEYDPFTGQLMSDSYRVLNAVGKAKRRHTGLLKPMWTTRTPSIGSFGEAVSYVSLLIQLLTKP